MFPETSKVLTDINNSKRRGRIRSFIILLVLAVMLNSGILFAVYPRLLNFIEEPKPLTIDDLKNIGQLKKGFDPNRLERSYFRVNFEKNDEYFADYFVTSWAWGTRDKNTSKFTPDYLFTFLVIDDLKSKQIFVLHAYITPSENTRLSKEKSIKYIDIVVNSFNSAEKDFIYKQSDILSATDKASLDLKNSESDKYYESLHQLILKAMNNKTINQNVNIGINSNEKTEGFLTLGAILGIEFLILLLSFISIIRSLRPLEKKLNYLAPEDFERLNRELETQNFKEFKYRFGKKIYFTESFIIDTQNFIIVPIWKILTYRKLTTYTNGAKTGEFMDIKFSDSNGKTKFTKIQVPSSSDLETMLNLIQERYSKLNSSISK